MITDIKHGDITRFNWNDSYPEESEEWQYDLILNNPLRKEYWTSITLNTDEYFDGNKWVTKEQLLNDLNFWESTEIYKGT